MTRPIAVLRPEPGNSATAARVEAAGMIALRLPMFTVRPVVWAAPDPADYDALLLTSANAIRHGGTQLACLKVLPVVAVGDATARAAMAEGFRVKRIGRGSVDALLEQVDDRRLLHLAGRDRTGTGSATITVYASDPASVDARRLLDSIALVHSTRAAAHLADIAPDRRRIAIVTISAAVAAAAGHGWHAVATAETPTDAALIAAARTLAD